MNRNDLTALLTHAETITKFEFIVEKSLDRWSLTVNSPTIRPFLIRSNLRRSELIIYLQGIIAGRSMQCLV